ncbi:MAG: efflux RND transporter periplasmic adaptor subunit [Polaromonas sp.]
MPSKTTWTLIAAAAAAVAALVWAFSPRAIEVETATVTQGRFEQFIEEDGRTRLKDRYTISAPVAARLSRMTLREGDQVSAGDTVAILTPLMSPMVDERSRREAEARLKAATAGVERATARVQRADVSLQEAGLELQRTGQLAEKGFVSPSRLDTTRLAVTASRRELDIAHAEREVARQEQAQASTALMPATASAKATRPFAVQSPVSGVVLRVPLPSEATIAAGAALLDIGDPARMEVVSELLTADAVQARPGYRAVIERWGGPPVEGRVSRVEPAAFTKVSALGIEEQRVKVLIDITDPPKAWRTMGDGFRVGVRIVTTSTESAVQVPVGALFPQDDGMAVYRLDGRQARLQTVEVAARNATAAWIRKGLAPGQVVVLYPPAGLADGRKVRVRAP